MSGRARPLVALGGILVISVLSMEDERYGYGREIEEDTFEISLDTRGYKYELITPVDVEVLYGRIRGKQRSPIEIYMPKPDVEYGSDAQFLPPGYKPFAVPDAGASP